MKISAEFLVSAAGPRDFPRDGLPEVAMIGRSNVGKSSLINALVRQRIARTSAAPGKTRLVNVYRVARGSAAPFYLVDLPGYGYARRSKGEDEPDFDTLVGEYFQVGQAGQVGHRRQAGRVGQVSQVGLAGGDPDLSDRPDSPDRRVSALLLVDTRHPGLPSDRAAWQWLHRTAPAAIVGTKIDKLPRGQRIRALRELESVFEDSVLPVSAVTGEGLDELWKLIDRLANSHPQPPLHSSPSSKRPAATERPLQTSPKK